MAKLSAAVLNGRRGGRPMIYPWAEWYAALEAGKTLRLRRGRDFPATTAVKSMKDYLRMRMSARGSLLDTEFPDAVTLVVRVRR